MSAIRDQNFSIRINDANNNIHMMNNNFDFIETCDIIEHQNNTDNSLESLKFKNWKYHLTNNKF